MPGGTCHVTGEHLSLRTNSDLEAQDMFGDFLQLLEDGQPVEEWVLEGFLEGHPPLRVVVEHPGHEVEHDALLLPVPAGRPVAPA